MNGSRAVLTSGVDGWDGRPEGVGWGNLHTLPEVEVEGDLGSQVSNKDLVHSRGASRQVFEICKRIACIRWRGSLRRNWRKTFQAKYCYTTSAVQFGKQGTLGSFAFKILSFFWLKGDFPFPSHPFYSEMDILPFFPFLYYILLRSTTPSSCQEKKMKGNKICIGKTFSCRRRRRKSEFLRVVISPPATTLPLGREGGKEELFLVRGHYKAQKGIPADTRSLSLSPSLAAFQTSFRNMFWKHDYSLLMARRRERFFPLQNCRQEKFCNSKIESLKPY